MPHQGGLAGLAWTRNDKHWIAAGVVFKSGFCGSGDVGHGDLWLLYMRALCGGMANCQCYCQLAKLRLLTVIHSLRENGGYTWKSSPDDSRVAH